MTGVLGLIYSSSPSTQQRQLDTDCQHASVPSQPSGPLVEENKTSSQSSLLKATDGALIQLITEKQLDSYKAVHEEIEAWLKIHGHCQNPQESENPKVVSVGTKLVTLKPEMLKKYIVSQGNFAAANCFSSAEARMKFMNDVYQDMLTETKDDIYHRVDISEKFGGKRSLESFVFRSKRMPNGDVAIIFSYFQDSTRLKDTWEYLVQNHDTEKLGKWLNYKLFAAMLAKAQAFKPRDDPFHTLCKLLDSEFTDVRQSCHEQL